MSSTNLTSQVEAKATGHGKQVVGDAWNVRRLLGGVLISAERQERR